MKRRKTASLIITVSAALAVTACSSSGNKTPVASAGATSTSAASAAPSSTSAASAAPSSTSAASAAPSSTSAASAEPSPTGSPFVVADVVDEVPGANFAAIQVGAKAAVEYINSDLGGINGRPVQLTTCDAKLDPATTTACANTAVSDKAMAVVGIAINWAANGLPVVAAAQIPSLTVPLATLDLTSPWSTPLSGGAPVLFTVLGKFAGTKGAKTIVDLANDYPTNHQATDFLTAGIKSTGGQEAIGVYAPAAVPDLTPYVVQAVKKKPDFIVLNLGDADVVRALKSLQQLSWPPSKVLLTDLAADNENLFKPAGATAAGVYIVSPFDSTDDTSNPQVQLFDNLIQKYSGAAPANPYTANGFAAIMGIRDAAMKVGAAVTSATLGQYLHTTDSLPVFMSKTLSASTAIPSAPSVHNPNARVLQWSGSSLTPVTDWISAAS